MFFRRPSHRVQVLIAILFAVVAVPIIYRLVVAGSVTVLHGTARPSPWSDPNRPAEYVGAESCKPCHEAEYDAWRGSQHELAMQPATDATVLGDFDDAVFEHRGVETRFFRRNGAFIVQTQGPDGLQHDYQVFYTLGIYPLQQYLIGFPDGREQALTVAWDSRPMQAGGERWFHLYPNEDTPPGDELSWTSPAHNWNFACAECHSTNLRKNYDLATDTYATTWSEINVSCEACHGPASRHVEAAREAERNGGRKYPADDALVIHLKGPGDWRREKGATVASLLAVQPGASEVETCGRCHARRAQLTDQYEFGKPLSETHRVQLLTDPYYFPDGQVLDEDYVYASFRQSRMFDMGVTCSDCHDPHTMKLRAPGNAMCTTCHAPEVYDVVEHHHHEMGTEGALCIECHMPTRTYMVVDPRRDHSMRIPRPDLSLALGVPNACNNCHAEESAEWSVHAIHEWYGDNPKPGYQTYARTLQIARDGAPGAPEALTALATEDTAPKIARATALEELARYPGPTTLPAIKEGLRASDPLMRRAAIDALSNVNPQVRVELLSPLLDDPVLDVRVAAASAVSDVRPDDVDEPLRSELRRAFEEYVETERFNADRAENWVNLAGFHFRQGDVAQAERDFAEARRRNPRFVPIYANQADMERALGRDADGERTLREGLALLPESAALHHSLGLLLIRTQRIDDAMKALETAYRLAPESARFGYVFGVALDSTAQQPRAIEVWRDVLERHPYDPDTLQALSVTLLRTRDVEHALPFAERLSELMPNDDAAKQLVDAIRSELARRR